MAEYILNRNYVLRSLLGQSVKFVKGEPTYVPRLIEREALAIGAECVSGDAPDILPAEDQVAPPLSQQERLDQLNAAFALLAERNDSKDFTGAGVPAVKAVEKIVDFDVDRNEVITAWAEYQQR